MNPLLLPVAAVQGIRVRRTTVMAPPATGPTTGRASSAAAAGPALRLGVVGESTAAGCGVEVHADGFPGRFAAELAERTGRPVDWQVGGRHGATARRIRHRLVTQLPDGLDVAVLLAGVNDVLTRRPPADWGDDLAAILDELLARAPRVLVTGVPPFDRFDALPRALRRYLAGRADALDAVSRRVCDRPGVTWIDSTEAIPMGPDFFASDGFHPSALGYARWAELVASRAAE